MVFSSLIFLFGFFPICLALYFLAPNLKAKNIILMVLSLLFYAWGEPVWVILLIFSAIVDFVNGQLIDKYRGQWQSKAALLASVVINLGLLATFKYSGFLVENINAITGLGLPVPGFSLPIGISFYTFQTLSYSIDVYRGNTQVQKSFTDFLLFVSLFPQLIAGPILRYADIAKQLSDRRTTLKGFSAGITRFVCGLAKKVLIANVAGSLATPILDGDLSSVSVAGGWFAIMLYAFQIYFDFSGYSDMAIGLGKMFGFDYGENFNYPYIARSATDFWRRWHISLSSFFRDYVYIPLGGNRRGLPIQLRNILIVWFLTGLWHGASWNFILWGLFYAVFLILEKTFLLKTLDRIPSIFSHVYGILIILVGWVFFYFTDLSRCFQMLGVMFGIGANGFTDAKTSLVFFNNLPFVIAAVLACLPLKKLVRYGIHRIDPKTGRLSMGLSMGYNTVLFFICTAALVGSTYNPFLYFRF